MIPLIVPIGRSNLPLSRQPLRPPYPAHLQSGARLLDPSQPLKEQAVEAILVRWQYADIAWQPYANTADGEGASSSSSASAARPSVGGGYVELPGFAGVWVGVREVRAMGRGLSDTCLAARPRYR